MASTALRSLSTGRRRQIQASARIVLSSCQASRPWQSSFQTQTQPQMCFKSSLLPRRYRNGEPDGSSESISPVPFFRDCPTASKGLGFLCAKTVLHVSDGNDRRCALGFASFGGCNHNRLWNRALGPRHVVLVSFSSGHFSDVSVLRPVYTLLRRNRLSP
jgi:hypothetical protein